MSDSDDDEPLGDLARRVRERREERARENQRDRRESTGETGTADTASERADEVTTGAGPDEDVGGGGDDADGDTDFDFDDAIGGDAGDERANEELFEEMDVADVDTDSVWEAVLTDEGDDEPEESVAPSVDIDPAADVESTVGDDHVVPKDDYCESCHFFSAPPDVGCSYEAADIVEVVDSEQFRVRNCPVVEGYVDTDGTVLGQSDG